MTRPLTLALAGLLLVGSMPRAAQTPGPPKLAVLIVVDQMRADYVDRFRGDWTAGLKRLATEGAWFSHAAYPYLETWTCPGHATIATGAFPYRHGIVQNSWFDRGRGGLVGCVDDPDARDIRYDDKSPSGGHSPSPLRLSTFADRLRATRSAHVVALSLKQRSAIPLAGRGGDAVTWLSDTLDGWQTSLAFTKKRVDAVEKFVEQHRIADDYGKTWTRLLPASRYSGVDDGPGEAPPPGWTRTFPHVLSSSSGKPDFQFDNQWERTPYADAYVGRFAAALVDAFQLGRHDGTDLLAIGFSTPDTVGHAFGPSSQEVQDEYAQLDRTLGVLFDRIDAVVGRGQWTVALSADHGVLPIPEQAVAEGKDAGRIDSAAVVQAAERTASAALGPGRYVAQLVANDLYFARGVSDRLLMTSGAIDRVAGAVAAVPGIARVFRAEELRDGRKASDPLLRAAALSYVADRSGDLVIAPKPGWMFLGGGGTTHGTTDPQNQRVPILFFGRGVKPGVYAQAVTPADVAPTLATICGTTMPDAEGRVLREALDAQR
jgi:predicted AlkP superfamily pyrophosphatase or phosphodiesterase